VPEALAGGRAALVESRGAALTEEALGVPVAVGVPVARGVAEKESAVVGDVAGVP
jgi:hypothetical protein